MLLYHYTSHSHHWPQILEDGYLRRTDTVLDLTRPGRQDVQVVWLTTADPDAQQWQIGSSVDKLAVRIVVDVPLGPGGAEHYPGFAKRHKVGRTTYRGLAAAGGDPEAWYVVSRRIYQKEWVKAELTSDGTVLWER